jgi:hypothetical protein
MLAGQLDNQKPEESICSRLVFPFLFFPKHLHAGAGFHYHNGTKFRHHALPTKYKQLKNKGK